MLAPVNKWLSRWFSFERSSYHQSRLCSFFCLVFFFILFRCPSGYFKLLKTASNMVKRSVFLCTFCKKQILPKSLSWSFDWIKNTSLPVKAHYKIIRVWQVVKMLAILFFMSFNLFSFGFSKLWNIHFCYCVFNTLKKKTLFCGTPDHKCIKVSILCL